MNTYQQSRNTGTYQQGLNDEARVLAYLTSTLGPGRVFKSSKHLDTMLDVDAHVSGVTVSIKCQHACTQTGNLCFELTTFDSDGREERSWYYNGQAECYLILVEDTLYQLWKQDLQNHVGANDWDRIVGLSGRVKQMQLDIGHRHHNVSVGLLKLDTLIRLNIATQIGVLNNV